MVTFADALGAGGGSLGYFGIASSLAVEFDTFDNSQFGEANADPNSNHIGVNTNGSVTSIATSIAVPDLNSGASLFAWVDYNGVANLVEIFVSTTSTKPGSPQLSSTVDLAALVGSQAFIGFSAGTGGAWNNHDIEDWSLQVTTPTGVPEPATLALLGLGVVAVALARRLTRTRARPQPPPPASGPAGLTTQFDSITLRIMILAGARQCSIEPARLCPLHVQVDARRRRAQ